MRGSTATGGPLRYRLRHSNRNPDGLLSVALGTALGVGAGLLAGLVLGEWLGDVHPERLWRLFGGRPAPEPMDPEQVERAVLLALRNTSATRRLAVSVRVLEGGVVELWGTAPDERTRQAAGEAAAAVAGADVVVNRILVEDRALPPGVPAPGPIS